MVTHPSLERRFRILAVGLLATVLLVPIPFAAGANDPQGEGTGYRLGPNDLVRIQVFGEDDLSVESKVDGDGNIHLPLLGTVPVTGKTVAELKATLAARLAAGYVRNPRVTAHIVKHRNFYLSGEVKTPGGYPYEEGLTVQKAISLAGGLTDKADRADLRVLRRQNGKHDTLSVTSETLLQPDDILLISESQKFYVSGEVKTPGRYLFEKGLTISKALSMAGGSNDNADREIIKVTRIVDGTPQITVLSPNAAVLPDDIIHVPESRKVFVSGEVKAPGRYLYDKGLTVQKALSLAGGRTDKAEKSSVKITRVTNGIAETFPATPEIAVLPDDILVIELEHHRFYASGEVKTPGGYPYQEGLTVHRALAMAGGLTDKAERGKLQILRRIRGAEETVAVQLDTLVLPDDIIVVAEGQKFFISGEVRTPGRFLYEKGLTVQKALSLAGGRTEKAERMSVQLTRMVNGVAKPVEVSGDAPLEPNDFIYVPVMKKVYVNGEVKRAGDYPYERDLTVHKAITMAGGFTDKASVGSTKILRQVNGQEQSIPVTLDGTLLPEDIIVVPRSFF